VVFVKVAFADDVWFEAPETVTEADQPSATALAQESLASVFRRMTTAPKSSMTAKVRQR
jgi:hypothetical protein